MRNDTLTEMIMSRAENICNIADNHARTIQVCIDRLHELGANEQLKVLTERLQKLAVRATAGDDQSIGGAKPFRGKRGRRMNGDAG